MVESQQLEMPGGYKTLQQMSAAKGVSVDALRMWVRYHQVPFHRVGRTIVVHEQNLAGYVPRGQHR